MPDTTGIVRRPEHVPGGALAPGVTAAEMLNDEHGCRGLHQRRLRFSSGAALTGTAGRQGEAWYVISGSGVLEADGARAGRPRLRRRPRLPCLRRRPERFSSGRGPRCG